MLKTPSLWDLEKTGMAHPLRGRWRGCSFPLLHHDVCLWEQDIIDPDSLKNAAIHRRREKGGA